MGDKTRTVAIDAKATIGERKRSARRIDTVTRRTGIGLVDVATWGLAAISLCSLAAAFLLH